jgi:succinate dehydrogenase / fumarate reductase cytochrome b subunit
MEVGFYQGCCFQGQDAHMYTVMEGVFARLGVKLQLLEETTCCGGNTIEEESRKLSYAINARNMALAEARGLDMLVTCNTCYMVIMKARRALDRNDRLRSEVNRLLKEEGLEYTGKHKVYHTLNFLRDRVGYERIRKAVQRPLSGLKVAVYYGCHALYPLHTDVDISDNPASLQGVLEAIGAEVIDDYESMDACCGYHSFYTDKGMTMKKLRRILYGVRSSGADIVATPCPLCFKAFDIFQLQMENPPMVPCGFLPELLAYAFGMKETGLNYHLVKVEKLRL